MTARRCSKNASFTAYISARRRQHWTAIVLEMALRSLLLISAFFLTQVAAHGYVPFIIINGTRLPGWDVTKA